MNAEITLQAACSICAVCNTKESAQAPSVTHPKKHSPRTFIKQYSTIVFTAMAGTCLVQLDLTVHRLHIRKLYSRCLLIFRDRVAF